MKKYVSIKDIVNDEKYPFSLGQLRALITKRHLNGLATSIRKIGRRIYIREDLFDEWFDSHIDSHIDRPLDKKEVDMNAKLEALNFSVRTKNSLAKSKIKTLEDLAKTSKEELKNIPGMGTKCLEEIEEKLGFLGLHLDDK